MNNCIVAVVRNIKIPCTFEKTLVLDARAIQVAIKHCNKLGVISCLDKELAYVYKKSIDARDKNKIHLVYSIAIPIIRNFSDSIKGVDVVRIRRPAFTTSKKPDSKPLVVGFGPSGMFAALSLAKAGLCPIVIERGADVDNREIAIKKYWEKGLLDENTNVQFGEGGAGTFSDGKLLTRINDELTGFVIDEFVKYGAPSEIKYLAKPHIGTDLLRKIVKNIRNEIISLGGTVLFNKRLESIEFDNNNRVKCAVLDDGDKIQCDALFLCIGHSARDTVKMLMRNGVSVIPKAFSVGARIEHLQSDINESMYGSFAGAPSLSQAQYTLSAKFNNRAVYSFCMCPGGTVVASASENGQIVTNGMSYYARDGKNANSALAVTVNESDYGATVQGAVDFQERIEKAAFVAAGSDSSAPIQLVGDFLTDKMGSIASRVLPTYTGKTTYSFAKDVLPEFVCENLKLGINRFEREIKGFSCSDAVLTFPETRTSSPVRIPRTEKYCASNIQNLYPCGEGAGYAGGITSAAVDGIRASLAYLKA